MIAVIDDVYRSVKGEVTCSRGYVDGPENAYVCITGAGMQAVEPSLNFVLPFGPENLLELIANVKAVETYSREFPVGIEADSVLPFLLG